MDMASRRGASRAPAQLRVPYSPCSSFEAPLVMALWTLHDIVIRLVHLLVCHLFLSTSAARYIVLARKTVVNKSGSKLEVPLMVPNAAAMDDLMDHRIENSVRIRMAAKIHRETNHRPIAARVVLRRTAPRATEALIIENTDGLLWWHSKELLRKSSSCVLIGFVKKCREIHAKQR